MRVHCVVAFWCAWLSACSSSPSAAEPVTAEPVTAEPPVPLGEVTAQTSTCSTRIAEGCAERSCSVTCELGRTSMCHQGNRPPGCGQNFGCSCRGQAMSGSAGSMCSATIAAGCGTTNCSVTCPVGRTAICSRGNAPPACGQNFNCYCR